MPDIVFISRFPIAAVGHGGHHRSYQIYWQLCQAFGAEQVEVLPIHGAHLRARALSAHSKKPRRGQWAHHRLRLAGKVVQKLANPHLVLHYLLAEAFPAVWFERDVVANQYKERLVQGEPPKICIIEHPSFGGVVPVNRSLGIRTVACFHNLEACDKNIGVATNPVRWPSFVLKLLQELKIISQADACVAISKTETGFLGGLGLKASYHPYVPVGEIKASLSSIRERRKQLGQDPDLFLMIGTSSHKPTGDGMRWFVDQVRRHGLPAQSKVLICGKGTEDLASLPGVPPSVTVKGWVEQAELDDLLTRANAVLIPQLSGFGALTKITECACAGIPVVLSTHPTLAIDVPPGVTAVDNEWSCWEKKITAINVAAPDDEGHFLEWQSRQPDSLIPLVRHYLASQ